MYDIDSVRFYYIYYDKNYIIECTLVTNLWNTRSCITLTRYLSIIKIASQLRFECPKQDRKKTSAQNNTRIVYLAQQIDFIPVEILCLRNEYDFKNTIFRIINWIYETCVLYVDRRRLSWFKEVIWVLYSINYKDTKARAK